MPCEGHRVHDRSGCIRSGTQTLQMTPERTRLRADVAVAGKQQEMGPRVSAYGSKRGLKTSRLHKCVAAFASIITLFSSAAPFFRVR